MPLAFLLILLFCWFLIFLGELIISKLAVKLGESLEVIFSLALVILVVLACIKKDIVLLYGKMTVFDSLIKAFGISEDLGEKVIVIRRACACCCDLKTLFKFKAYFKCAYKIVLLLFDIVLTVLGKIVEYGYKARP